MLLRVACRSRRPCRPLAQGPFCLLAGPHHAATAKLSITEAVDEVRDSDEEVQVEWPILTVLKGSKTIEHERLFGLAFWPPLLMKEQAVTAEALHLSVNGAVRHAERAADPAQTGAPNEAMEDGFEKTRVSQPIGEREAL